MACRSGCVLTKNRPVDKRPDSGHRANRCATEPGRRSGENMLVQFHGLRFDLPPGWMDVTDDLPDGSPPTLTQPSGCGVIQFSIASCSGGGAPEITIGNLRSFLADFCARQSLVAGNLEETVARVSVVGCVLQAKDEVVAAWYLTNSRDVVLVTYCSPTSEHSDELDQARHLVATIDF